mmetsp:Transcript_21982/g.40180  ORF Transcript_21982/g.40180 Transcript_21982/m.40180 type:complete len:429 (-) Transcript_21982:121-1407(-)
MGNSHGTCWPSTNHLVATAPTLSPTPVATKLKGRASNCQRSTRHTSRAFGNTKVDDGDEVEVGSVSRNGCQNKDPKVTRTPTAAPKLKTHAHRRSATPCCTEDQNVYTGGADGSRPNWFKGAPDEDSELARPPPPPLLKEEELEEDGDAERPAAPSPSSPATDMVECEPIRRGDTDDVDDDVDDRDKDDPSKCGGDTRLFPSAPSSYSSSSSRYSSVSFLIVLSLAPPPLPQLLTNDDDAGLLAFASTARLSLCRSSGLSAAHTAADTPGTAAERPLPPLSPSPAANGAANDTPLPLRAAAALYDEEGAAGAAAGPAARTTEGVKYSVRACTEGQSKSNVGGRSAAGNFSPSSRTSCVPAKESRPRSVSAMAAYTSRASLNPSNSFTVLWTSPNTAVRMSPAVIPANRVVPPPPLPPPPALTPAAPLA